MKPSNWFLGTSLGILLCSPFLTGCSLIGLSMDASKKPDTLAIQGGDKAIEGKTVIVTLRDGYSFASQCRKVGTLPAELYRSRYAEWRKVPDNQPFPFSPGDTLFVAWNGGDTAIGVLEGFERNAIVMSLRTKPPLLRLCRAHILSVPLGQVDTIRTRAGHIVDGPALRARSHEGTVPTREGMLLRRGEALAWLPLDEVVEIKEIRYSYDWLHKGAIADAVGLAAAVLFFAARQ